MANTSLALAFYARYPQEMDEIWGEENHDLIHDFEGMQRNEVVDKVNLVGERAVSEVKKYLDAVRGEAVKILEKVCNVEVIKHRNADWYTSIKISQKSKRRSENTMYLSLGICTYRDRLRIYNCLWAKGGRRTAQKIKEYMISVGVETCLGSELPGDWSASEIFFNILPIEPPIVGGVLDEVEITRNFLVVISTLTEDDVMQILAKID